MKTIATLLTCHNRREKTLNCLQSLFDNPLPSGYILSVFLVDDGSTDGTSESIKANYPEVNIIKGNGNLFWNQGMRLAWETASKHNNYDFYFWLNDDTILDKHSIQEMLECYEDAMKKDGISALITGTCRVSPNINEFSYGGRTDSGKLIPNGKLQVCKYINGNAVLVPKIIFDDIGNLSPDYTHTLGDYDYGLRALKAGFNCYSTKNYIATCQINEEKHFWSDPKTPLNKRLQLLNSPKGLCLKEYIIFRKKFWGWKWIIYSSKAYLKALLPSLYKKISN